MLAQCCTDCIVFSAGVAKPCTHAGLATCVEVLGYLVHYPCLAAANGATTLAEVRPTHWWRIALSTMKSRAACVPKQTLAALGVADGATLRVQSEVVESQLGQAEVQRRSSNNAVPPPMGQSQWFSLEVNVHVAPGLAPGPGVELI